MLYNVSEIFTSVQGEGKHSGRLCTFIRMGGCNLTCPWCDSKETWSESEALSTTIAEIMDKVDTRFVVITGGEPTLQDLIPLMTALKDKGCEIAIETNGTNKFSQSWRYMINCITCSPKPPLFEIPYNVDEIKLVVSEELTDEIVERAIEIQRASNKVIAIYLQPEFFSFEKSVGRALDYVKQYPRELRLGIQAHKVWGIE